MFHHRTRTLVVPFSPPSTGLINAEEDAAYEEFKNYLLGHDFSLVNDDLKQGGAGSTPCIFLSSFVFGRKNFHMSRFSKYIYAFNIVSSIATFHRKVDFLHVMLVQQFVRLGSVRSTPALKSGYRD